METSSRVQAAITTTAVTTTGLDSVFVSGCVPSFDWLFLLVGYELSPDWLTAPRVNKQLTRQRQPLPTKLECRYLFLVLEIYALIFLLMPLRSVINVSGMHINVHNNEEEND